MTWKQTYTGLALDLLAPLPEQVCIEDIAQSLSKQCRFTGHTLSHYSVAQHSWLVAEFVAGVMRRPELGAHALLHDAAETYTGDISSPMKAALRAFVPNPSGVDPLKVIERRIDAAIAEHFNLADLSSEDHAVIKYADLVLLATEKRDLMVRAPRPWDVPGAGIIPWDRAIGSHNAENSYWLFMLAFERHMRFARSAS